MQNRGELLARLVEAHEDLIRILGSARGVRRPCAHVLGSPKMVLVEELELGHVWLRTVSIPPNADG